MKGRSSSNKKGEMEVDKEGAHLSGAYIRSLVKQLTSSRTTKDPNLAAVEGDGFPPGRYQNFGDGPESLPQQPPPPPQQPKKQVRRRLHTTRPYQERLLNMAEARREIVTALKFHRASMKQQQSNEQQHPPPPPPQQQLQPPPPPPPPQEGKSTKCRRNPRIYPSNNSDFYSNYCSLPNNNYSWLSSSQIPPPLPDSFDLSIPNQPLGLNLNFQDFNNFDATLYHNSSNPSSIYSSSISPSSSSSISNLSPSNTSSSIAINQELPTGSPGGGLGLHHAIDDEEMEEIRWIGEQHDMEWNDTMNLVTSAWWFKFLKTSEIGGEEKEKLGDDACYPFEEVMEFPAWLNGNESCMQQHCFSEQPLDDLMEDDTSALPCMDIGEIEGMDGEWWA